MKPTDDDEVARMSLRRDARPGGRSYDNPVQPQVAPVAPQASPEDMARWIELDDVAETSGILSPNESEEYHCLADKYGWYVEPHYAGGTVDWTPRPYAIDAAHKNMSPTGNFDPTPLNVEQTAKFQAYHAAPEGAQKHDSGKSCRPELLDPAFTKGVGRVLAFGATKYAAGNWSHGMEWSRLIGALERHILAFKSGEEIDPETGECHLYHAGCMLAFLSSHWEHNLGVDDREEIGVMWPETQSERNGKV